MNESTAPLESSGASGSPGPSGSDEPSVSGAPSGSAAPSRSSAPAGSSTGRALDRNVDLLPDALPAAWLLGEPTVRGRIKVRAEDFLVDEIPLYEPAGEGEHLYVRIQKRHLAHAELMAILTDHYGVGSAAIGFAGMKDRVGITQQTVSIHLPGVDAPAPPVDSRLEILWQARHANKLRRGHLGGNRFSIRVRDVDPLKGPEIWRRLRRLVATGVPDYFGPQRFGYRRNNHVVGRLLLLRAHEALLAELLGALGTPFPEHQREARELFDAGRYDESLRLWHRGDRAERAALRALASGASPARAVRAVARDDRDFWISALQSAIFNRVLSQRVIEGSLGVLEPGDIAFLHQKGALFRVSPEELASTDPERELPGRLARFEISPSGPLPGTGVLLPSGRSLERELAAIEEFRAAALLEPGPDAPAGTRRPLRVQISNASIEASFDEHGPFVRLAFDLPKGAYATVVMRELFKDVNGEGLE